ncbi:MAG TPA: tetratricopeptide repeat protein [Longimicrobiaceae bacterium]|jgi:tetratricopeptide (TPR) repeat protein
MANVAKLRERARVLEQRDQWKEALDVYLQLVEEAPEEIEVGLWNRIGDIHIRLGQSDRAVEAYDRAVDAYAEAGLHNNAIALCRKVLRIAPARASVYLKLGQISAAHGFLADARQNFLEYAARMQRAGQLDASFAALEEFADLSPDDTEVRVLLAEQLLAHGNQEKAVAQLLTLRDHQRARGDEQAAEATQQRVLAIDPHADLTSRGTTARAGAAEVEDFSYQDEAGEEEGGDDPFALEFHGSIEPSADEPAEAAPLPGLDLPVTAEAAGAAEIGALEGLETAEGYSSWGGEAEVEVDDAAALPLLDSGLEIEHTSLAPEPDAPAPLPLLDEPAAFGGLQELEVLPGFGDADLDEEGDAGDPLPFLDMDAEADDGGDGGIPGLLDTGFDLAPEPAAAAPARDAVEELRERVAAAPDDTAALHRLVDLLEDRGQGADAEEVLVAAHRDLGSRGLYREAIGAVRSLLARRPEDTAVYQKQVEYAFRAGDTESMVRAYLDLGRHLGSPAENPKSRAVYQRVLEMDPANEEARRVLAVPAAPAAPPAAAAPALPAAPAGDYVDLGSLIMEDEPAERTTRFVVEEEEPSGDEDRDFADMLAVFRQKVNENISAEDAASHYDLGLAFMEMGLVDEAIAEFQVALRAGANPLATLELLGRCFVDKGQSAVAARVLERALRIPGAAEADLVGVVYQLARCHEAMGDSAAAQEAYERVLAFDIRFRDTMTRLEALRRASSASRF